MNNLHTLTSLTGRNSGANRTIIVQGFEARRRTVVVAAIGLIPALLLTIILWGFVGQYAILALPAVEGLTFWLIESRSRTGLQRRTYETLLDKKRSDAGQFSMCGRIIDPELNELGTLVASTVPKPGFAPVVDRPAPDVFAAAVVPVAVAPTGKRKRNGRSKPVESPQPAAPVQPHQPAPQFAMAGLAPAPAQTARAASAAAPTFDTDTMFGVPSRKSRR